MYIGVLNFNGTINRGSLNLYMPSASRNSEKSGDMLITPMDPTIDVRIANIFSAEHASQ